MALSNVSYTWDASGNPGKTFTVSYGYIVSTDLSVQVNAVLQSTANWSISGTTLTYSASLVDADVVKISRDTGMTSRVVDWVGSGIITESDLDTSDKQFFYGIQELIDGLEVVDPTVGIPLMRIQSVTDLDAAVQTDVDMVAVYNDSGAFKTMTLPTAIGVQGKTYLFVAQPGSGDTIRIAPKAGELIDGLGSYRSLTDQRATRTFVSDGAGWVSTASEG